MTRISKVTLLLAMALFLCATAAIGATKNDQGFEFAKDGERIRTFSSAEIHAHERVDTVEVHEPYEAALVRFRAVPFAVLLDSAFGESWREDTDGLLVFGCLDGYAPVVPIQRVRDHRAWVAFGRVGRDRFAIDKHEAGEVRRVPTAPFYLVWENLRDKRVLDEGDYGWPYQLVRVDWVRASAFFPRAAPETGASAEIQDGFRAFRIHCVRCHSMNGEGGKLSTELNLPVPAIRLRGRDWMARWIDDPSAILPTARMPRLNPTEPSRGKVMAELLAYLMAKAEEVQVGNP